MSEGVKAVGPAPYSRDVSFTIHISGPAEIIPEVQKDLDLSIQRNLKAWERTNGMSYSVSMNTMLNYQNLPTGPLPPAKASRSTTAGEQLDLFEDLVDA